MYLEVLSGRVQVIKSEDGSSDVKGVLSGPPLGIRNQIRIYI